MQKVVYDKINEIESDNWWYRIRIKILKDIMRRHVGKEYGNKTILDIGCGAGGVMKHLKKSGFGRVVGMDFSPESISICRENGFIDIVLGDACSIPFPDSMFDVVTILDVLEHIEDDRRVLSEIRRVLKPNGIAIIFVPAFSFLWGETDIVSQHKRRYVANELVNKAIEARLTILRRSYFNFFLFLPILLRRQLANHVKSMRFSEYKSDSLMNPIYYVIFYIESILLRFVNFPFGVSIMLVCKK